MQEVSTSSKLGFVGGPGEGARDARGDGRMNRGSTGLPGADLELEQPKG